LEKEMNNIFSHRAYPNYLAFPRERWQRAICAAALGCTLSAFAQDTPTKPDALLAIEMQRSVVIEKIVSAWNKEIPVSQQQSLTDKLATLRADHLLAASMSGSFDGVLEVLSSANITHSAAPAIGSAQGYYASRARAESKIPAAQNSNFLSESSQNLSADSTKALGDANADLVYTPLVPCRLFDTRAGLASALGTVGGTFSNQQTKTITPAGACGIPTSGVASVFLSFHAFNNNPERLGVIGFMNPGGAFSAMAATWTGAPWVTGTFITRTNPNASFDAFVGNGQTMSADMIVDVMGYFRAPNGGSGTGGGGTITAIQTAAGSGLTGGVTTGAANLSLGSTYKLPQSCANAQVPKYNTASGLWECQNDLQGTGAGGTGTVTNIATGAGLSGGPITTTGTINLAATQLLPTTACAANQIPKWNGTSWACAADTSPTNAWTQGGNAFGAPGVIGTNDLQPMTLRGRDSVSVLLTNSINSGGLRVLAPPAGANLPQPNIILGSNSNALGNATGLGMSGMTISGGSGNIVGAADGLLGNFATVGGGSGNSATSGFATVGGGFANAASGNSATASGGQQNTASGVFAAVGGGRSNTASGTEATVAGGEVNTASANNAAVGGGVSNVASGVSSVVPGGRSNVAGGDFSFAAGNGAKVRSATVPGAGAQGDQGTFIWADSINADFVSTGSDQFLVRARGGFGLNTNDPIGPMHVRLGTIGAGTIPTPTFTPTLLLESPTSTLLHMYSPNGANNASGIRFGSPTVEANAAILAFNDDQSLRFRSGGSTATRLLIQADGFVGIARTSATHPLHIGTSATTGNGAHLTVGGAWTNGSSRAFKDQFAALDAKEMLRKVVSLPVMRWNYKGTDERHIGPIAEDFHKTFNVGSDPQYISTVDASGVALAAIQGLAAVVKEKDAKISALEKTNELMLRELSAIKRKLGL
jgi:trimeric autotransporter adhesin